MKNITHNGSKILAKAGFTLVELLTVMAILGILIAVAIAAIGIAQRGARDNTRTRDMTTIQGLLNDYYGYSQDKKYPSALNSVGSSGNITEIKISNDPNVNDGIKVQQKPLKAIKNSGIVFSSGTRDITTCPVTPAASDGWELAYTVDNGGQGFGLCTILENGTILNLSTGR